jgi:hypothetical protein
MSKYLLAATVSLIVVFRAKAVPRRQDSDKKKSGIRIIEATLRRQVHAQDMHARLVIM